jgi:hypothetical protein
MNYDGFLKRQPKNNPPVPVQTMLTLPYWPTGESKRSTTELSQCQIPRISNFFCLDMEVTMLAVLRLGIVTRNLCAAPSGSSIHRCVGLTFKSSVPKVKFRVILIYLKAGEFCCCRTQFFGKP